MQPISQSTIVVSKIVGVGVVCQQRVSKQCDKLAPAFDLYRIERMSYKIAPGEEVHLDS
jgi:hypothetical protein